jgi:hypothetical protein
LSLAIAKRPTSTVHNIGSALAYVSLPRGMSDFQRKCPSGIVRKRRRLIVLEGLGSSPKRKLPDLLKVLAKIAIAAAPPLCGAPDLRTVPQSKIAIVLDLAAMWCVGRLLDGFVP